MPIRMECCMMRWISILVPTIVVGLTAIMIIGCGGGEMPSQVVEKYYQLLKEKDCQGLANYINDQNPELVERRINECKQSTNIELVSYSITGETINEGGISAWVDAKLTIKENGVEKTNFVTKPLVKRGDDWKLTETENRSSKPPN